MKISIDQKPLLGTAALVRTLERLALRGTLFHRLARDAEIASRDRAEMAALAAPFVEDGALHGDRRLSREALAGKSADDPYS